MERSLVECMVSDVSVWMFCKKFIFINIIFYVIIFVGKIKVLIVVKSKRVCDF